MKTNIANILVMIMLLSTIIVVIIPEAIASDTLYESYTASTDNTWNTYSTYYLGQSFTIGNTGTNEEFNITSVKLKCYRSGSPGNCYVKIYASSGGKPTGSAIDSTYLNGNSFTTSTSGADYEWIFSSHLATCSPSTMYCLVISGSGGSSSHSLFIKTDASSPSYSGGTFLSYSGTTWTVRTTDDAYFYVYGVPTNKPPEQEINYPSNNSVNISTTPKCSIWANDTEGSLTVTWQENTTGSWVTRQVNTSVSINTLVNWTYTQASTQWKWYWYRVYVSDGSFNVSSIYKFKTMLYYFNVSYSIQYPSNNSIVNYTKDYIPFSTQICRLIIYYFNESFNKTCLQGYNTTTKVYFNNTLLETRTFINGSYTINILENYTEFIYTDTNYSWSINTSFYNLSYNRTYYFTPHIVILNAPSGGNGTGNGTYNVTINITSSDGMTFTVNWTGDYTGSGTNITFPVNSSMIINGLIEVISMSIVMDVTQLGLVFLVLLTMFCIFVGYLMNNSTGGVFLLISTGLIFNLMVMVWVYFAGVFSISMTPLFVALLVLFAKDGVIRLKNKNLNRN